MENIDNKGSLKIKILMMMIIITGGIIALLGYSLYKNSKVQKITIGVMDWPGFYPAVIAHKTKIYEKNGLDVSLFLGKDNPDLNAKISNGILDFSYGAYSDFVFLNAQGVPIKYIFSADHSESDFLVASQGINSVHDLKNKVIGFGDLNTFSEIFVNGILNKYGFKEGDVNFVVMPFYEVADKLKSKEISAGHTWEPEMSEALSQGGKIISSAKELKGIITDGLVYRNDKNLKFETIQAVILSHEEAVLYLKNNYKESLKIMSEFLNVSEGHVDSVLKVAAPFLSIEENLKFFESDEDNFENLKYNTKYASDFYFQKGRIPKTIKAEEILDDHFIKSLSKIKAKDSKNPDNHKDGDRR